MYTLCICICLTQQYSNTCFFASNMSCSLSLLSILDLFSISLSPCISLPLLSIPPSIRSSCLTTCFFLPLCFLLLFLSICQISSVMSFCFTPLTNPSLFISPSRCLMTQGGIAALFFLLIPIHLYLSSVPCNAVKHKT